MNFIKKLERIQKKNASYVCIGLDSDVNRLPDHLKKRRFPQYSFNKAIIDATHDLVCAYKPNSAFYEARGEQGMKELKMTCDYVRENYPEIPVILDAKRADIGSTNNGYVQYAFDYLQADAITVHPYLGREALKPFLDRKDKGIIVLCRTSNPGAGEFQDLAADNRRLYMQVAHNVAKKWNANNNCLLVVGATYPEEIKKVRRAAPGMTFLIPGVGAQGGDVEKTVRYAADSRGRGMIVSSSRGVIFASEGRDFAKAARVEADKLRNEINSYL